MFLCLANKVNFHVSDDVPICVKYYYIVDILIGLYIILGSLGTAIQSMCTRT
jgi:hypothetical protein